MLKTKKYLAEYGLTPEEATAILNTNIIQQLLELEESAKDSFPGQVNDVDERVVSYLQTADVKGVLEENRKEAIVTDSDLPDDSEFEDDFDFGDFESDDMDDFGIRVTDADKKIEKSTVPRKEKKNVLFAKVKNDVSASVFYLGYMGTDIPEIDSDGAVVFTKGDIVVRGLYNENFSLVQSLPMGGEKMRVEVVSRDGSAVADAYPVYMDEADYNEVSPDVLTLKREEVSKVFDTQQYQKEGTVTNTSFDAISNLLAKVNAQGEKINLPAGIALHPKMVADSNFYIAPKKLYALANCPEFFTATILGYRYITNFCEANDLKQLRIFELGGAHLNIPFNNTRNKTIANSVFMDEDGAFSTKVSKLAESGPREKLLLVGFTDVLPKGIQYEVADNLSADAGYFVFASQNSSRVFYVLAVVYNYFRKYYNASEVSATVTPQSKQYTLFFGDMDMPSGFIMIHKKNAVAASPARLLPANALEYAEEIVGQNALAFREYVDVEKAREELTFTGEVVEAPVSEAPTYDPREALENFKRQLELMQQSLELFDSPDDDAEIAVVNDRIEAAEFMIESLEEEVAELAPAKVVMEDEPSTDTQLGEMIIGNDQDELILPSIGEPEVAEEIQEQVAEIEEAPASPSTLEEDFPLDGDDFDFDDDDFDFAKGGRTNRTKHIKVGYVYLNQFGYELEDEVIEDSKDVEEVREKWKSEMINDPDLISYQIVEVKMDGSEKKVPSKFHGFAEGGRTMDDKVSDKIRLLREEGKPQDQAVAIALSMRDDGKLEKGGVLDKEFKFDKNFVIYVPSTSNVGDKISDVELNERVSEVEELVANEFGGFTKTETDGGYKSSSGDIIEEDIVKVSVFSTNEAWAKNEKRLVRAIKLWAKEWGQEAIGFEYENDLYYIDAKGKMEYGGIVA
jgi:hypothetical protein